MKTTNIITGEGIKKLEYLRDGKFYYTVPFVQNKDELTVCVSSQIGCPLKCTFCATGDMPFVRNLTQDDIAEQIIDGTVAMQAEIEKNNLRKIKVIAEGMGDSSFNIENLVKGFWQARPALLDRFGMEIADFGISTIGNTAVIEPYKALARADRDSGTTYDFQISLHAADSAERKTHLIPNMPRDKRTGKELSIEGIVDEFVPLARELGQPFKFNFLLLQTPEWNNFSEEQVKKLVRLCEYTKAQGVPVQVKLTEYSDTGKTFSSPERAVYERVVETLRKASVNGYHRPLMGLDVQGACGQLHYEQLSRRNGGSE